MSLTPIMLIAVTGCIPAIRQKGRSRPDAIVALVLLALYLLVSTGIEGYAGSSPGPRYLVPVIPFFALPLADRWRSWKWLAAIAAIWSPTWMILATLTDPLYLEGGQARADRLHNFLTGSFERSIPGQLTSRWTVAAMVPIAIACAVGALYLNRRFIPPGPLPAPPDVDAEAEAEAVEAP